MTETDDLELLVGKFVKVCFVDDQTGRVYFELKNGQNGWANGFEELPKLGQIMLIKENFVEFVPSELWPDTKLIAVVKRTLPDSSILIDDGYNLKRVSNPYKLDLKEKYTVEYNADGILKVIDEKPLRSRDREIDWDEELKLYRVEKTDDGPKFSDFGGYAGVVKRSRQLIETQLERREQIAKIGARPVKGVLFTGPPGTGKTFLAKIIANETDADFFLVSGPSIVSKWVGETEETLRRIFEAATDSQSGRAIIFFDEIDSIAENRTSDSHEASKRLVAQLLTLMDGFDEKGKNIIVIAATNRVETLDPALTRPGRFDWEIEFGLPEQHDRVQILVAGSKKLNCNPNILLNDLANLTEGWSAAELSSIWTEAALLTAEDERESIASEDLARAYERIKSRPRRGTERIKHAIV